MPRAQDRQDRDRSDPERRERHRARGRRVRGLGAALLALLLSQTGLVCSPILVAVTAPVEGAVVTGLALPLVVVLGPEADPETLEVRLNGVDVTDRLSGGPETFVAWILPGPPLQHENQIEVRVAKAGTIPVRVTERRNFTYDPPRAIARVIDDPEDCPTGPLAHCRVGDLLLANDRARFVIQKPNQRELHFTGTYGGNLIDAELVEDGVRMGRDNLFELQPAINIESVINAVTAEIVHDGEDGAPAVVRTCGPDDLLDDINPSSVVVETGFKLPPGVDDLDYDVWGCTEYRLAPRSRALELVTTIESMEPEDVRLFVGDFVAGGELEQWTPLSAAAPLPLGEAGVGEMLANWGVQAISFYGAGEAAGVDYALVTEQPAPGATPSSTFSTAGVTYLLHGQAVPLVLALGIPAEFEVPAGGSASFRRWFAVGDGSAANAITAYAQLNGLGTGTLRGCVRDAAGTPLPGARVVAGRDTLGGTTALEEVRAHWVTDADGCYDGRIPPGAYLVAAARQGSPYEGGGPTPTLHPVALGMGRVVVQDVVLPVTGRLAVAVKGPGETPVPARISVVGFDPSPEPVLIGGLLTFAEIRTNLFYDRTADGLPPGMTRTAYTEPDGTVAFDLEPGSYWVVASRGTEWSIDAEPVTITAGETTAVDAAIAPVLDTDGWLSADYHVHMIDSPDSRVSRRDRIRSYAGEGVDVIVATDHAAVTDLVPDIAAAGFTGLVGAIPGEEITTFDYGHFNAYPLRPDPTQPQTQGATDHAGAAPPGQNFPAYGHFNLPPAEIEALVLGDPRHDGLETVVQVNHIDSHFGPLKIDSAQVPPRSQLEPGEASLFRLDPAIEDFHHHFAALELWNGESEGKVREFLDLRLGIWMNLLNQGRLATFVAGSDTHQLQNLASAGARNWTPASNADPASFEPAEIGRAVRAGKLVGGQGLFVTARLVATDGSDTSASLAGVPPAGAAPASTAAGTLLGVTNGAVDVVIRVQAPTWAPYDRIELYRNAATQVTGSNGGVPTLYTGLPTTVLHAGTDFTVETVAVNGAERLETNVTVHLDGLEQDEWIVVAAGGSAGISPPMFPVYPYPTSLAENPTLEALMEVTAEEQGMRAFGMTNALYVDVDGNGVFDPPGVSVLP